MLNQDLKINKKIFDKDVEQTPIRKGFGEGLLAAAKLDARVVGLCADLTESTQMHLFKKEFGNRFIEMGVAEQNLASVASGMAAMGKIPFITSYAMFSPGRNWEQIRTTICYNNQPVKIAGSHAGISVGPDGGTHQAIEDLAILNAIPRMVIISPCDSLEAKRATLAIAQTKDPSYIRLAREKTPIITTEDTPFEIGKMNVYFDSTKNKKVGVDLLNLNKNKNSVLVVATGALLYKALKVAQDLSERGQEIIVLNASTIKPFDQESLLREARKVKGVVTVEEHQINGGLGSIVASILSRNNPKRVEMVAVQDQFGQSGTPDELLEYYGLGEKAIKEAIKRILL